MTWRMFQATYALLSPLHIGFHKVGFVQHTRCYIPARNLWAAVTERLTRSGFTSSGAKQGDYAGVGRWLQEHCAFSYGYLLEGDCLLYPAYGDGGLRYGTRHAVTFERAYLSSHVTTALDGETTSAAEGSLHEVEFIAPHSSTGQRTLLRWWVWLDDEAERALGKNGQWASWLKDLQVGGERTYGFGRLIRDGWQPTERFPVGHVEAGAQRPLLHVAEEDVLLAHTAAGGIDVRGMIEPVVGRETGSDSATFGKKLTRAQICWVPGSVVTMAATVQIAASGIWQPVVGATPKGDV